MARPVTLHGTSKNPSLLLSLKIRVFICTNAVQIRQVHVRVLFKLFVNDFGRTGIYRLAEEKHIDQHVRDFLLGLLSHPQILERHFHLVRILPKGELLELGSLDREYFI